MGLILEAFLDPVGPSWGHLGVMLEPSWLWEPMKNPISEAERRAKLLLDSSWLASYAGFILAHLYQ